jgi:hypothetical protein
MSSAYSCPIPKKIAELLDGVSNLEASDFEGKDDPFEIYNFSEKRSYYLPGQTAKDFFNYLCQGVDEGVSSKDGDALYFYGERLRLGNSRPLRIRFRSFLSKNSEEDNDLSGLIKILISCIVMTLGKTFQLTERGLEYKTCGVIYSADQDSSEFDIVIQFPYCRMKDTDFNSFFLPSLNAQMDKILGGEYRRRFTTTRKAEDLLHTETREEFVPYFGCVGNRDEEPKNIIETWYVNRIPASDDDIMEESIIHLTEEEEEEGGAKVEEHPIFAKNLEKRPTGFNRKKWKPLIYTSSFSNNQERLNLKRETLDQPRLATRTVRDSPSARSRQHQTRERKDNEDAERDIQDLIDSFEDSGTFGGDLVKIKNVVKCIKYKMKVDKLKLKIHDLIFSVVERELTNESEEGTKRLWFKMGGDNTPPPIQVGSEGLYIPFDVLLPILYRLKEWRCMVTSQLEDIACIVYTMANFHEKEVARDYFTGFVETKSPEAFQKYGGEKGLGDMFDRQRERAVKKRLTVWTLLHMFEEDDELYYNIWWKYICDYYVLHSLENNMASFSVARAASLLLVGKFIHTTGDAKQTWWKYSGTHWKNIHDTQSIELALTTTFIDTILCVERRYHEIISSSNLQTGKFTYFTLRTRISESSFRNNVIKDMSNIFLRDNRLLTFAAGTDPEYSNFFATINHVYYYSDGKMNKRKGHWEDFLTRAFDVIDENLDVRTDPKCLFIKDWVHKMLRDKATEHEFLKEMGSFLRGFNRDKRFSVWYGHGNGGKSKFMDLVCSTLGLVDGYAVKFPLDTLLEGARKSAGAASPEIDQGRGAFLAVLDEPKKGQKFDAGKIKAITGNDAMYTRTLFSKGGSFRPMFKTVLLGNVMPKADYDMAMKIRFWVWWFKGRFADPEECPATREEQDRLGIYPLDKDLDNKLPQYKSAMLSIMLHYYELYCKEGIKRTENIRRATDMFWNSANDVLCFLSEQTVQSNEMETYVPTDDLYDAFRRWFMNRNNGDRVMTKIIFQDELEAIYTNQKIKEQGGLAGVRLRDGV